MQTDALFQYSDERFADLQLLRYKLHGFENLTLQQKKYIYFLSRAALAGRDITTDQFGKHNLLVRTTLETIYLYYQGDRTNEQFCALIVYLKRIWFSNGIYHHYGSNKIIPDFTQEYFIDVLKSLPKELLLIDEENNVNILINKLITIIFNKDYYPKRVNKTEGQDLILTSACNYYENVTQIEVEKYYNEAKKDLGEEPISVGLNSKLVKKDGIIQEEPWTATGIYAKYIKEIIAWLSKACEVAENQQQQSIIRLLIAYYQTGNLELFNQYCIAWLNEQEGDVDFINGFIEVYGDPLGYKGSWEGLVNYKDPEATKRTRAISENAQWFEDHSPVDQRFKKSKVKGVTANVVCAAMLGGDEYPASAIGINLPNAEWIRAIHGSKSITIGNLTEAYRKAAEGNGFNDEFVIDGEIKQLIHKYSGFCDDLHTDLHECVGHGSGQLLHGVDPDALKAYGDVIEEARADLFGLYFIADKKMVELNLLPNETAYHAQYYTYMMNGLLTQLARIEQGHCIEEAHMRNRALITRWVLEHSNGVVELIQKEDENEHTISHYVQINDYKQLRNLFGKLLAEVQRIKSEGDFFAAQQLVERYGVTIDCELHQEILTRYQRLNIAPFKGFINPWPKPIYDKDGNIIDIELDYTETFEHQMLRYSNESKQYGI